MKFFVIFVFKKNWQVSVTRNKILFLATDTCQFLFIENIQKQFTFFDFSTFLLKIGNLIL